MFGSDVIGISPTTIDAELMGNPDPYIDSATSASAVYRGNVPAMFDRGLLELVASDPHKGIIDPGAYNAEILPNATIGETTSTVPVVTTLNDPGPLLAGIPPTTGDKYVFTPLNSWKYWPQSVSMKFSHVIRRTMYNPTNRIMTVYITELRRKRSQLACTIDTGLPANADSDTELLDIVPWGESQRLGWQNSAGSYVSYFADSASGAGPYLVQVAQAGEFYRRFLYIRFGQYEQMQLQSRGFNNVASESSNTTGPEFKTMGQWDPRMSYNNSNPDPNGPTDPHAPASFGYSFAQAIRDPITNTSTTAPLTDYGSGLDPYNSLAAGGTSSTTANDYLSDVTFNPLNNPFLKRLFYMRRTRYVIAPGGSAVHTFRTGGNVNPIRSRLLRYMKFYSLEGANGEAQATRQYPYCLPFPILLTPAPLCHAARKSSGWTSVGAITQVKGQMVFLKAEVGPQIAQMQYSQTRIVCHDRSHVRFRVCSYGKPVVGGASTHTSNLAVSNTPADYYSMNPTAPPQAVVPSNSNT